jgi:four helix bundle protein
LNIAEGSVSETDYLLLLAKDLGYLSAEAIEPLAKEADEIGGMLYALRTKVEAGVGS